MNFEFVNNKKLYFIRIIYLWIKKIVLFKKSRDKKFILIF